MRIALSVTRNLQSKLGSTSSLKNAAIRSFTARNYTSLVPTAQTNNRNHQHATPTLAQSGQQLQKKSSYTTYSQLPSEHQMVYEMCRKFADEELAPKAGEWDQKHEFPTEAVDKLVSLFVVVYSGFYSMFDVLY